MSLLRRRRLFVGLVVAAAAALLAGPLAQSASAATFFRSINSASANTSLAISSSQNNAPLVFVPEFKGKFVCATCGIAGIPTSICGAGELAWQPLCLATADDKCADVG